MQCSFYLSLADRSFEPGTNGLFSGFPHISYKITFLLLSILQILFLPTSRFCSCYIRYSLMIVHKQPRDINPRECPSSAGRSTERALSSVSMLAASKALCVSYSTLTIYQLRQSHLGCEEALVSFKYAMRPGKFIRQHRRGTRYCNIMETSDSNAYFCPFWLTTHRLKMQSSKVIEENPGFAANPVLPSSGAGC